jgi:signal transduction histidine kinase
MKHPDTLTLLAIAERDTAQRQPLHTLPGDAVSEVLLVPSLPDAFQLLQDRSIDVVLFDLSLLHLTGSYSFRRLVEVAAGAPIILLARMEESNLAGELLRLGAQDCLIKDQFDHDTLQRSIQFSLQRKWKEGQLERSERQKQQEIMEAVLKAEEKERTSIGEELHDNINQVLASAKLYIETAIRSPQDRDEYLRQGVHIIDVAIQEIRQLSKDLVATGFRHHGLVAAIKDATEVIETARGIRFAFNMESFDESILSEGHKLALYRMVQEQLNNIVKHAHATEVYLELYTSGGKAALTITDNGRGFDTAARPKGIGLSNIASRASFYNGTMQIRSAPGKGCQLKVVLGI